MFKRFAEENLLQISCSDIVERFTLFVFLVVILAQNVTHGSLSVATPATGANGDSGHLRQMVGCCLYMFLGEVVVDWVKHAFVTKFNQLRPHKVYGNYGIILSRDIAAFRLLPAAKSMHDHSHAISRRLGLSPLPLACVVIRLIFQTSTCNSLVGLFLSRGWVIPPTPGGGAVPFWHLWLPIVLAFYACLLSMKLMLSTLLLASAAWNLCGSKKLL